MPGSAILAPVELTEAQLVALSDAVGAGAATVRRAADVDNCFCVSYRFGGLNSGSYGKQGPAYRLRLVHPLSCSLFKELA